MLVGTAGTAGHWSGLVIGWSIGWSLATGHGWLSSQPHTGHCRTVVIGCHKVIGSAGTIGHVTGHWLSHWVIGSLASQVIGHWPRVIGWLGWLVIGCRQLAGWLLVIIGWVGLVGWSLSLPLVIGWPVIGHTHVIGHWSLALRWLVIGIGQVSWSIQWSLPLALVIGGLAVNNGWPHHFVGYHWVIATGWSIHTGWPLANVGIVNNTHIILNTLVIGHCINTHYWSVIGTIIYNTYHWYHHWSSYNNNITQYGHWSLVGHTKVTHNTHWPLVNTIRLVGHWLIHWQLVQVAIVIGIGQNTRLAVTLAGSLVTLGQAAHWVTGSIINTVIIGHTSIWSAVAIGHQ